MRALVTGASRGIGAATAVRLAMDGFEVAVHYHRHRSEAQSVVRRIRSRGGSAFTVTGDVSRPGEVRSIAHQVAQRWPSLDALVQNAGTYERIRIGNLTDRAIDRSLRENLIGPMQLTRDLLPCIRKARHGAIVFVSSILAYDGSRHGAQYAAAKAGLLGFARSLARELAPKTRVNVVAPGSIDTAILAGDSPRVLARRARRIPLGRIGNADEVAEAIAFLVSERSSYISGATVHVNGGARIGS